MTENESRRGARRQQRGLQRLTEILDAASLVFAEVGYSEATTNAIAARAGISPGSLYQFFPNKEAIAAALAHRYKEEFYDLWRSANAPEIVALPFAELVDYIIDVLLTFTQQRPGFHVVFFGADISPQLSTMGQELHQGVLELFVTLIAARSPSLTRERCELLAEVVMKIYKAFVPLTVDPNVEHVQRLIGEMKVLLRGYLAPWMDVGPQNRTSVST